MKVCKFGGSSLADAAQFRKVIKIILEDPERRIVVVSAPGQRHPKDVKVTDLLIRCAEARLAGGTAEAEGALVLERFAAIQQELGVEKEIVAEIERDLRQRLGGDPGQKERFLDSVKALGEDACAKLMAAALRQQHVHAQYVNPSEAGLLLSAEYGNAQLLPESYEKLATLKARPGILVIPGFFGYTRTGQVVTFPRGGSDISGAVIAAAVRADIYENFTDVDCVFAADPRLVPNAAPIEELTYREMRELSYAGFTVIHDEAIVPVVEAGIPIWIRNTNRPEAPGTRIVPERRFVPGRVVGIASDDGFCTIFLEKYLMNREVGYGRRLLQILEEEGLSYEHCPSGIDNLSVILREDNLDSATKKRLLRRIKTELKPDDVDIERGLALIMIVGEGMRYTVGLAARATQALADAGVNIEMMNQGSSEISMMFGVKAVDRHRAVVSLYRAFFEEGSGRGRRGKTAAQGAQPDQRGAS